MCLLDKIKQLAAAHHDIDVLWLYGSRARNSADQNSDYDLAVLFSSFHHDVLERRLRPELLAMDWQQALGCSLSVIDITQVSVPLAYTVVQDNCVLLSKDDFKQLETERIIMSKWDIDYQHHLKHYA
ncbi:type VII toxin-antitoxin system MntA family adenylyltransferase antitoxin [Catenovulum sediminis]|uniref:Nucleotidyltransferase domain-containing protein n=2 Tax=Catenovulum sediminis TaxID=1740262 RepID=A0ABV1RJU6_9ALTE